MERYDNGNSMKKLILFVLLLGSLVVFGQRPQIAHSVYNPGPSKNHTCEYCVGNTNSINIKYDPSSGLWFREVGSTKLSVNPRPDTIWYELKEVKKYKK